MAEKKKHHFRPVLHLKHFANSEGKLWVYRRIAPAEPRLTALREVGAENNLYSYRETDSEQLSPAFEDWLDRCIDSPAAPALARLADGLFQSKSLDNDALACFIAAQELRLPRVRQFILAAINEGLMKQKREIVRASALALYSDATEEEIDALVEATEITAANGAWLNFIATNVERSAQRLLSVNWTFVTAPSQRRWFTNDVGVVKFASGFDHPIRFTLGWAGGVESWFFPFGSGSAVAISPDHGARRAEARPRWASEVNHRIVADSEQFVATSHVAPVITKWLRSPALG